MQTRRFGRTEIQMPVFSTGGMRYQDSWQDKPLSEVDPENQKNLEATIRRSLEVGINHIETARGYGSSERQLGVILPTLPREQLIVQTKIAPEKDAGQFVANFHESLERLQLDYVDLLGLHGLNNPETIDWSLQAGGCLQAARELQKQGKVRHVGFSTHGTRDDIMRTITGGDAYGGFDYVNLHYYYIYRRNWAAIQEATRRDMGVFIISPSNKGGNLYSPPAKLSGLCEPLQPMEFNDLWCLQHPEIHTLSLGAARPSDYDLHLEALGKMEDSQALLPVIDQKLRDAMLAATGVEHPEAMSWDGVPEYHDSPGGFYLSLMLWLDHLDRGWDMEEYAKMRYNLFGNGGHWFPGRKAVEFDAVSVEEIRAAVATSPFADKIPNLLKAAAQRLVGDEVKRLSES